jgi:hypothetical protein
LKPLKKPPSKDRAAFLLIILAVSLIAFLVEHQSIWWDGLAIFFMIVVIVLYHYLNKWYSIIVGSGYRPPGHVDRILARIFKPRHQEEGGKIIELDAWKQHRKDEDSKKTLP